MGMYGNSLFLSAVLGPATVPVYYLVAQMYLIWKYRETEHSNIPKGQLRTTSRWLIVFLSANTLWFINAINIIVHLIRYETRTGMSPIEYLKDITIEYLYIINKFALPGSRTV